MSDRLTSYDRDGLRFDVRDEGPLDGTPVVLLHGFPERATSWRLVAPLLHEAGYRTYAPDQRGYSPCARPRRRRDHRSAELRADVEALVARIGSPVHLVGHDWGAAVAWDLAAHRSDLVRSLTAVSVPHPGAFVRAAATSRQGLHSWYMLFFQLPRVPEWSARRPGGRFDRNLRRAGMTHDEVDRFRTEIVLDGALRGGLSWYRALPFADRSGLGARVAVPTTFVWSDGDTAIARRGVDLTAARVSGDYRLVVLEGVSHWIPTQAPAALAAAAIERMRSA
ncbi:alpha/beta fold hydrolase [Nocardioides sp. KIGAM211]|uniref:Alpha/beta fold hydrolase n=1 Tax=Nocardioides luti TaxID=2761101 RepID=A0A7X0RF87_9ACTN|nr:alpha/beta fold hydrolase [Nocardioides luti]MBB6627204.1 alpha/beta fold hydrolase [Nocardioides luti]